MMQDREQKRGGAHPLLYVLTALVAVNLVVSAWIALHFVGTPATGDEASKPLPAALEQRHNGLAGQVIAAYNRQDYAGLYDLFDPYAKAQSSQAQVTEAFERWREILGDITSFTYSHHQYAGRQVDRDWYDLFYKARFSGDRINEGVLKIRVAGNGDSFGIMRVDLVSD